MPKIVPFSHNDIEALEKRLKRMPEGAGKLVVLEGVYSMLGDIAPLKEMIARRQGKRRDGAGRRGAFDGLHRRPTAAASPKTQGVLDDVDFVIGTFSKSVGTVGGFCVSNHPKFEILRLVCRPYVFTAVAAAQRRRHRRDQIRKLMHGSEQARASVGKFASTLHAGLKALGFQLGTESRKARSSR